MNTYYLHWSALAAITKYHRPGGLNNRHLFLTVLEAWKSKIKVLANSVPGESSLPGLQLATLLLCSHMAERERAPVCLPLLIRTLVPP